MLFIGAKGRDVAYGQVRSLFDNNLRCNMVRGHEGPRCLIAQVRRLDNPPVMVDVIKDARNDFARYCRIAT